MANLTPTGASNIARARFQNVALPTSLYFGLMKINKGTFVPGATYQLNDYVIPTVWATYPRIYKCTTLGLSSTEPTWTLTAGGTSTSGAAVFTEQTTALLAGTVAEADYTGYSRATVVANNTNFSEDLAGHVTNLTSISFGANSGATGQTLAAVIEWSAATAGSVLSVELMTNPQVANPGGGTVTTAASSFTCTVS